MKEPCDGRDGIGLETELQLLREKLERLEALRGANPPGRRLRRAIAGTFLGVLAAVFLLAIMGVQSKPDALFIDANGNVGINQTSPQATLDVNGSALVRGAIKFSDGTTQTTTALPSGAVIAFNLTGCPAGWAEYKPAYGRFIRGIDRGKDKVNGDPAGERSPGNYQGDAIRNITGSLVGVSGAPDRAHVWGFRPGTNGAFNVPQTHSTYNRYNGDYQPVGGVGSTVEFNSSRVVPTAEEDRPKNVALLYCEKQKN